MRCDENEKTNKTAERPEDPPGQRDVRKQRGPQNRMPRPEVAIGNMGLALDL